MSDDMLLHKVVNLDAIKQMKVTVDSAIKYGTIVGAAAIASSLLGGRTGLLVGGAVGSYLAGWAASGKYESVPDIIINEITTEERKTLLRKIGDFILSHGLTILQFVYSAFISQDIVEGIVAIVICFLKEKGLHVLKAIILS